MRVFISRHNPNLQPGQGYLINWAIGERTLVISGMDNGRIFIVLSEGKTHREVIRGTYVREGYFEDDPHERRVAKSEAVLWFTSDNPDNGPKSDSGFRP